MKFGILGSGFGLYGYLPALLTGCDQAIFLPERYRARLSEREDVCRFGEVVHWCSDECAVLEEVDAVVLALRPVDQSNWIHECMRRSNVQALLLEKPLAQSPTAASRVLDLLEMSKKKYRVGYNFRFLPWAAALTQRLRSAPMAGYLAIDWQFRAHHYEHDLRNWKRSVSTGGGALRFFGIHLVGLLAEVGFDRVISSVVSASEPDECEVWSAAFTGPNLPECRVRVQSNAALQHFSILASHDHLEVEPLVNLSGPFETESKTLGVDRRVGILTELCKDLIEGTTVSYPWYRDSVKLWEMAERMSAETSNKT